MTSPPSKKERGGLWKTGEQGFVNLIATEIKGGVGKLPKLSKESRIKKELDRISQLFEKVDANQRAVVAPLLQNAAFMAITLQDLQELINEQGVVEVYTNGAHQQGMKPSSALQSYNALVKNYAGVIKTLPTLLPPEEKSSLKMRTFLQKPTEEEREAEQKRVMAEADYWAKEAGRVLSNT